MIDAGSLIQNGTDLVMIVGGAFIFVQNWKYWRKYNYSPSLYWVVLGGAAIFLGCWVSITQYGVPLMFPSVDPYVVGLLALSRRVLVVVVLLYMAVVSFWEYVLNK